MDHETKSFLLILAFMWSLWFLTNPEISSTYYPSTCNETAADYIGCLHGGGGGYTEYTYLLGNTYIEYEWCCTTGITAEDVTIFMKNHVMTPMALIVTAVTGMWYCISLVAQRPDDEGKNR